MSASWWQCLSKGSMIGPLPILSWVCQDQATVPQRMNFLWCSILVFSRTILRLISIVKVLMTRGSLFLPREERPMLKESFTQRFLSKVRQPAAWSMIRVGLLSLMRLPLVRVTQIVFLTRALMGVMCLQKMMSIKFQLEQEE